MAVVLVVAPHPDDETLGCGGTLLRHVAEGDAVHWLIATAMTEQAGYAPEQIRARAGEIDAVAAAFGLAGVHALGFPAAGLDAVPLAELASATAGVVRRVAAQTLYLPHPGDAHSDHRRAFEMCVSATKWFREPSVAQVFSYETLSETGFHLAPSPAAFRPTLYVDIARTLERKLEILELYGSELAPFPFPRSREAVRALAALRGAESGFAAAEGFAVLRIRR